jgi:hypothetical protein
MCICHKTIYSVKHTYEHAFTILFNYFKMSTMPDFIICQVKADLIGVDNQGIAMMNRMHPLPNNIEIKVFITGLFPTLARIFDYSLYPYTTTRENVIYPTLIGMRVTKDQARIQYLLNPNSACTIRAEERELEQFYFTHGEQIIANWEASGFTTWSLKLDSPDQTKIKTFIREQTIHKSRLYCIPEDFEYFTHMNREVFEQLVRDKEILVRHQKNVALGFEAQIHDEFIKLVEEKNKLPVITAADSSVANYSYITYFNQTIAIPTNSREGGRFGFECVIVPHAERISVESAMQLIFETTKPIFFFGCDALRQPDKFTLSMVNWDDAMRGTIDTEHILTINPISKPKLVFVNNTEPRFLGDAIVTSDPSYRFTAPHVKRYLYTLGTKSYNMITFYVTVETTRAHLAFVESHTLVQLNIVNIEKSGIAVASSFL